jgi:hypothetical protein
LRNEMRVRLTFQTLYTTDTCDGGPFLVMEYLKGHDLARAVGETTLSSAVLVGTFAGRQCDHHRLRLRKVNRLTVGLT